MNLGKAWQTFLFPARQAGRARKLEGPHLRQPPFLARQFGIAAYAQLVTKNRLFFPCRIGRAAAAAIKPPRPPAMRSIAFLSIRLAENEYTNTRPSLLRLALLLLDCIFVSERWRIFQSRGRGGSTIPAPTGRAARWSRQHR